MTPCDFCPAPARWLGITESPDGSGQTSIACQGHVDLMRRRLARIGPPTITPLDERMIPEKR